MVQLEQEVILQRQTEISIEEVDEALILCKSCGHVVPKTMFCLYCGAPILFKEPRHGY